MSAEDATSQAKTLEMTILKQREKEEGGPGPARDLFFRFICEPGLFFFQQAVDFFYQGDQLFGILLFFGQLAQLLPPLFVFSDHEVCAHLPANGNL
jgi:hypothetical protein